MKLSRWYPGKTDPVSKGVYQRDRGVIYDYSRWDGRNWHSGCSTVEDAAKTRMRTLYSKGTFRWRGLAKKAKEAK